MSTFATYADTAVANQAAAAVTSQMVGMAVGVGDATAAGVAAGTGATSPSNLNGSTFPGGNTSATTTATTTSSVGSGSQDDDAGKKKKTTKRRKVNHACLYCRRSHMTCDEGRPCQRCIKREIGHLCHDERRPPKVGDKPPAIQTSTSVSPAPTLVAPASTTPTAVTLPPGYAPVTVYPTANPAQTTAPWPMSVPAYLYPPETFGNEFSVLTDFLETLDEGTFFSPPTTVTPALMAAAFPPTTTIVPPPTATTAPLSTATPTTTTTAASVPPPSTNNPTPSSVLDGTSISGSIPIVTDTPVAATTIPPSTGTTTTTTSTTTPTTAPPPSGTLLSADTILPSATKTEKFLLTAADQESGSRDERLNRVIRSKYEAGLLKPYNYVKGYARLSRWMDRNVSQESKQQILQPLSVLRPKFRAVAQSLRDLDLVFIEEAFERLLLDYDRVFSAMGVPACLWRRTGEIYKGNREFSELVGVDGYMLRDGRLCIYELMAEESAVNYWEKYGHVAFDSSQKAVLTSCVLRYKPKLEPPSSPTMISKAQLASSSSAAAATATATSGSPAKAKKEEDSSDHSQLVMEEGFINCCFSFTIRRDKWGIPSMIVGNFIRC